MNLYFSTGRLVKMKGTDQVVHFARYWPHLVAESTELWELVSHRILRHGILEGKVEGVESQGSSLHLFLGSILFRWGEILQRPMQIHHAHCGFALPLEGLKLMNTLNPSSSSTTYHTAPRHQEYARYLDFLHRAIEKYPTETLLGNCVVEPNAKRQMAMIREHLEQGSIVILDTFKRTFPHFEEVLQLTPPEDPSSGALLLTFRTTRGESQAVFSVDQTPFLLPSLYPILARFDEAGWNVRYRFMPELDRDYLLPFEGDYGLCILFLTREDRNEDTFEGLQVYPEGVESSEMAVARFDPGTLRSYDSHFGWELPVIDHPPEPDWTEWAAQRSWEAKDFDWSIEPVTNWNGIIACSRLTTKHSPLSNEEINEVVQYLFAGFKEKTLDIDGCLWLASSLVNRKDLTDLYGRTIDRCLLLCHGSQSKLEELLVRFQNSEIPLGTEKTLRVLAELPEVDPRRLYRYWCGAIDEGWNETANYFLEILMNRFEEHPSTQFIQAMMDPNEATQLSKLSSLTKEPSLTDDPDLLAKILEQAGIQHTRAGVLDPVADFAQRLTALRPQSMIGWALRGFADFRSGGNAYADHLKFSAEIEEKPHPYSRVLVSVMLSEIGVDPRGLDYPESVHLLQSFCQAQNADPQISDPGDDEQNTAPEDDSEGS